MKLADRAQRKSSSSGAYARRRSPALHRWTALRSKPTAVKIAPGIYSILIDGESFEARVEPDGRGLRLTVANREWQAEIRDPREWRRNRSGAAEAEGRQQVLAPMPGKIVRVLVGAATQWRRNRVCSSSKR